MIDSLMSVLALIVKAAVMSHEVADTLILLTIGVLMVAAFSGTMCAVGVEWAIKSVKQKATSLFLGWAT